VALETTHPIAPQNYPARTRKMWTIHPAPCSPHIINILAGHCEQWNCSHSYYLP